MNLKNEAESVRMIIDRDVDILDIESLIKKLSDLTNISGLSAELVPKARMAYRETQEATIIQFMNNPIDLPVSTLNDLIKAKTRKEEGMLEYCERLDKRISYTQESLRTIISLRKTEISNSI